MSDGLAAAPPFEQPPARGGSSRGSTRAVQPLSCFAPGGNGSVVVVVDVDDVVDVDVVVDELLVEDVSDWFGGSDESGALSADGLGSDVSARISSVEAAIGSPASVPEESPLSWPTKSELDVNSSAIGAAESVTNGDSVRSVGAGVASGSGELAVDAPVVGESGSFANVGATSSGDAGAIDGSSSAATRSVETARRTRSVDENCGSSPGDPAAGNPAPPAPSLVTIAGSASPKRCGVIVIASHATSNRLTAAIDAIRTRPTRDVGSCGGAGSSDG